MYCHFFRWIAVVNCVWGEWSAWGYGDNGTKQRARVKTVEENNVGTCDGLFTETEQCSSQDRETNLCPSKNYCIFRIFREDLNIKCGFRFRK